MRGGFVKLILSKAASSSPRRLCMTDLQAILQTAQAAAQAAAQAIRAAQAAPLSIKEKNPLDVVTNADLAADLAMTALIRAAHPDHTVISEENELAAQLPERFPAGWWWCLDPIDGTANFSRGGVSYGLSIGIFEDETLKAGLVYDVERDQMFTASLGGGAWVNGRPLRVNPGVTLQWALLNVDWHTAPDLRQRQLRLMDILLPQARSLRSWGTSALALAHLAAGAVDMYSKFSYHLWDVAGGFMLVQAAGGKITDLAGQPWTAQSPDFLATAGGPLHEIFLAAIAESASSGST
jgi:myo-inositol-1(or 4)-monophosphatase